MFTASIAICIQQTVKLHFWYFNALFYSHLLWGEFSTFSAGTANHYMYTYDYFLSSGTNRVEWTGAALVENVNSTIATSTSIYDLWWDLLILNFMFFLNSHNFHSYDCDSIMMTVMSKLWLCSDSSVVLWYAVMKYCRRRFLWQNCMSLKVI